MLYIPIFTRVAATSGISKCKHALIAQGPRLLGLCVLLQLLLVALVRGGLLRAELLLLLVLHLQLLLLWER